jgi:hypothetical protein
VTRDAISDSASREALQKAAGERLAEVVKARLAAFDPNHDAPREVVPPREQWVIGTNEINL